jgi:hypothetical protein
LTVKKNESSILMIQIKKETIFYYGLLRHEDTKNNQQLVHFQTLHLLMSEFEKLFYFNLLIFSLVLGGNKRLYI